MDKDPAADAVEPLVSSEAAVQRGGVESDSNPAPDAPLPVTDAEIPWRGMSSSPAAQAPPVGILNGMQGGCSDGDVLGICHCRGGLESDEDLGDSELVLGVKLSQYGPVYFFKAGQEKIRAGCQVLVEAEQGLALGEVVTARRLRVPLPKIHTEEDEEVEIKPIRALAGPGDIAAASDNRILAASARLFCKECIRGRQLDMKLVDVEVLHDRSKIIFYFTAPSRIDFRELVKDLVRNYHTRIELRQIGVRHETQMIGAVGNCGMTSCCRRYLRKFAPVTIKMAKEQNLFLNPTKLSGICGRLLCCLAYEQENYEEFHKRSPKIGKKYKTSRGFMRVLRANLFRQSIFVMDENNEELEMQLDEWEALLPVRHDQGLDPSGQTGAAGQASRRERRDRHTHDTEHGRAGRENSGSSIAAQHSFQGMVHDAEPEHAEDTDARAGVAMIDQDSAERLEFTERTAAAAPDEPDEPVRASRIFNGSENDAEPEAEGGHAPADDAGLAEGKELGGDAAVADKQFDNSIFGLPGARFAERNDRRHQRDGGNKKHRQKQKR